MKIYVAGRYTGRTPREVRANVKKAINVGIQLILKGHDPYIPHLTYFVHMEVLKQGVSIPYETWLKIDEAYLEHCDALLFISSSNGADRERDYAVRHGITVFTDINQIMNN